MGQTVTTNPTIDQFFGSPTTELPVAVRDAPPAPCDQCKVTNNFGNLPSIVDPEDEIEVLQPATEYAYVQSNLKKLIRIGIDAAEDLQAITKTSQAAREFEVLALLINNTVAASEKLIDIQLKHSKLVRESKSPEESNTAHPTTVTNNTVIVGTMNDILQRVQSAIKQPIIIEHEIEEAIEVAST